MLAVRGIGVDLAPAVELSEAERRGSRTRLSRRARRSSSTNAAGPRGCDGRRRNPQWAAILNGRRQIACGDAVPPGPRRRPRRRRRPCQRPTLESSRNRVNRVAMAACFRWFLPSRSLAIGPPALESDTGGGHPAAGVCHRRERARATPRSVLTRDTSLGVCEGPDELERRIEWLVSGLGRSTRPPRT